MNLYKRIATALALSLAILPTVLTPAAYGVAQDAITNTFSFPLDTPSATAISPDGTFAIVSSVTSGVYRINLLTNTVVDTITVANGGYRTTITPDGRFALLLNQTDGAIYKMDLSNDSITATYSGITSARKVVAYILTSVSSKKEKLPLSVTHPELAKEADGWDPTTITSGFSKKFKWCCKRDHLWEASISSRKRGSGCPSCAGVRVTVGENDFATTFPEIAKEVVGQRISSLEIGNN